MDYPLKVEINKNALKLHLQSLIKCKCIEVDQKNELYDKFLKGIEYINSLLCVINYNEITYMFVYHFVTLIDEIDYLNQNLFYKMMIRCGLFMTEDLRLSYQRKNFRYNKLYKVKYSTNTLD